MKYSKYNVAIIGSGISGLFLANKLAQNKEFSDGIVIITKGELFSGSSSLAQGGIVSVIPEINIKDSIEGMKDFFNYETTSILKYDAIIAQEPCEATEHIIRLCTKEKFVCR